MADSLAYDADARTPVDASEAVSGLQRGTVLIGISITLPLMYSAGELAQGIGFKKAAVATLVGALVLSLMSVPAAIVGAGLASSHPRAAIAAADTPCLWKTVRFHI